MAERLLGHACRLHVYDPSADALAPFVDGGPSRMARCEWSPTWRALSSHEVGLGPHGVVHGSGIRDYVEMSTIGQDTIEGIGAGLAQRGMDIADASVSGGPAAAPAGTLAMLISAMPATVAKVSPLLDMIGKEVFPRGDRAGMAQIMKIVNNVVMAANMVVCAEGLAMGEKAGLDVDMMMRLIDSGSGQRFTCSRIMSRAVSGKFDFGAALTVIGNDMALGLAEARLMEV
ncbi:NAD(P)-dependent oxidoreductase [Burkholderia pseudomultivorans]|nr:NAD-binding protein [Burkholderia pseudomultivorans]